MVIVKIQLFKIQMFSHEKNSNPDVRKLHSSNFQTNCFGKFRESLKNEIIPFVDPILYNFQNIVPMGEKSILDF